MIAFDEAACQEFIKGWIVPLAREIERQTEAPVKTLPPHTEYDGKTDTPTYLAEVGGCVIALAARPAGFNQYIPVLVVCEKRKRRQRHGVGHSRDYHPVKGSDQPSFDKAVANALQRNKEIDLAAARAEEVDRDLSPPPGVKLAAIGDGNYSLHIGTLTVTPQQAAQVCNILKK